MKVKINDQSKSDGTGTDQVMDGWTSDADDDVNSGSCEHTQSDEDDETRRK